MKRNNIFKAAGTFFMAGVFAFTFAACDSGLEKGSTYEGAEELVEGGEAEINEPTIGYENGEYVLDQEYGYEERELVSNRLREDIDRADRSLEQLETELESAGENIDAATRREWEERKVTLERERERLNMRLEEVENATEQTWERVRSDANTTLRDWEREWEELRTRDIDIDVNVEGEAGTNE